LLRGAERDIQALIAKWMIGRWHGSAQTVPGRIDWDDGRRFHLVACEGQILSVARLLGLNQAALSRRTNALEEALRIKLLIRRTHGCDLTETGGLILETLEQVGSEF
jgi:DNA-binding transcriptional LysR family regulator